MKNLAALLILFAVTATTAVAQDFETPKTGAKIYLAEKSLEVSPSGEQTFDVFIVRSKKAQKTKFDAPKLAGSNDLSFTVEQNPENKDHYTVTVKASDVASGKYFYTITSRSNGIQRINGTTTSINVGSSSDVAAVGGN